MTISHLERMEKLWEKTARTEPLNRRPNMRDALKAELTHLLYAKTAPAVMLSGGLDSQAILYTLLDLGITPVAYTFTLGDTESRDYRLAKKTAEAFGVEHRRIKLSTDPEHYLKFLRYLLFETRNPSKAFNTCMWPMLISLKQIHRDGLRHVAFGLISDWYFAMSRKWGQLVRTLDLPVEEIFIRSFRSIDEQVLQLRCEATSVGMTIETPFGSTTLLARMIGGGWKYSDVNKPREKEFLRRDFEDYLAKASVVGHQGFQLGDTGIGAHVEKVILESRLNTKNYKKAGAVLEYALANPEVFDGVDTQRSKFARKGRI